MIVTGAFLANAANASDNTLNVLGGVWDTFTIGPGEPPNVIGVLVVLTQSERDQSDPVEFSAEIVGPDGTTVTTIQAVGAETPDGVEQGFVLLPLGIQLPALGRYSFVIGTTNQTPVSISLIVKEPQR